MPRNIEIKARVADPAALYPRALALATAPEQRLEQDDEFFRVPTGRLKLRRYADGSAELIHYQRGDGPEARASDYVRVPLVEGDTMRALLLCTLGADASLGRVRKRRTLVMHGRTRIHLDQVEGLGDFMELEVVLGAGEADAAGAAEAETLVRQLGLADAPRVAGSYFDLLRAAGAALR